MPHDHKLAKLSVEGRSIKKSFIHSTAPRCVAKHYELALNDPNDSLTGIFVISKIVISNILLHECQYLFEILCSVASRYILHEYCSEKKGNQLMSERKKKISELFCFRAIKFKYENTHIMVLLATIKL